MNYIVETANNLLKGIGTDWDSMTQDQQVKLSFLLYRNQYILLQQQALLCNEQSTLKQTNLVARTMWDYLDLNTLHGPRLEALVRKGGDYCIEKEATEASHYETFLEWSGRTTLLILRYSTTPMCSSEWIHSCASNQPGPPCAT